VGDIINVEYGMAIPVDGLILQATQLSANEAAMTGESDDLKKDILRACNLRRDDRLKEAPLGKADAAAMMHRAHELPSPLLLSGTAIASGEGKMVCLMVGDDSCIGIIMKQLI
jgi:magnesium-transporting ATPase (P-type)